MNSTRIVRGRRFFSGLMAGALLLSACMAERSDEPGQAPSSRQGTEPKAAFTPQVVVAISDSGVNPYHEIYYRPDLTEHPCTYVEGYSCDIPALPLSVGRFETWEEAFRADEELWNSIELHQWYWVPQTNLIGVVCDTPGGAGATSALDSGTICILDDSNRHGTGTSSSVLMEAPETLLLMHEGTSLADDLATAPVVADIQSHSWAAPVPLPLHPLYMLTDPPEGCGFGQHHAETLFFLAAGNEALWPVPLDFSRFCPSSLNIGGGTSESGEVGSWTFYDFASWYCRPGARTRSVRDYDDYCGTSFAAPTAAGTAAAALLAIRRAEDYTGRNTVGQVSAGVTREAFIQALRLSASYDPQPTYPNGNGYAPVPLLPGQEYLVWGWGFLDQQVVPAIVACALGQGCPDKSAEAITWNQARHDARQQAWESAPDCPVCD